VERNVPFMIKYNNFFVRTIWTVVMLIGYITIINAGHFYVAALVFLLNIAIFKEILSLKRNYDREIKIPLFYLLNWYFFAVAIFYFYGKLFSSKLTRYVLSNWQVSFVINYLNIISFMLWIVGFLGFVLSLRQGYYRY
jgi:phosphatidate cytidylyltransferase